ncbi:MAG: metal ABC transporter permease, partial [Alphaproteobacteria bacterium]|nr:metal ABC transporter permease [Alphaproteobacteria bacterium]
MDNNLITPFFEYAFMRRALAACLILSLSGTLLGVFITLKRMTLVGDAVSHAVLPGIAAAFFLFGFAVLPMAMGGIFAGIIVAVLAVLLIRFSSLKTDAALAVIYLSSLAIGVVLISLGGTSVDLSHFLVGDILAVDD